MSGIRTYEHSTPTKEKQKDEPSANTFLLDNHLEEARRTTSSGQSWGKGSLGEVADLYITADSEFWPGEKVIESTQKANIRKNILSPHQGGLCRNLTCREGGFISQAGFNRLKGVNN